MFYPLQPGMLQKSWVRLSLRLPKPVEVAKLAKWFFGSHVGERSTKGGLNTRNSKEVLDKAVDITRLQVPPRAPERQSKGCLFFCQSILAKISKTPVFPISNGKTGIFYTLLAIVIYSQVFLSIFVTPVGGRATKRKE